MKIHSIRKILLQSWDPLGVGDNSDLADEYDAYLPLIYDLLNSSCTYSELLDHLKNIEDKMLETKGSVTARELTAKQLILLRQMN